MKTNNAATNYLVGATVALALTVPTTAPAGADAGVVDVTVDFAQQVQGVKSLAGLNYGIVNDQPGGHVVHPLGLKLYRHKLLLQNLESHRRIVEGGGRYIWEISPGAVPYPYYDGPENWERRLAPHENWTEYEAFLNEALDQQLATGLDVIYDIWNEPNCKNWPDPCTSPLAYFHGDEEQWFETFRRAHNVIRGRLGSEAVISAPGYAGEFDFERLRRFVDHARDNNLRFDILAWHELRGRQSIEYEQMVLDMQAVRAEFIDNPAYAAVGIKEIQIQEYIGDLDKLRPGTNLAMLYHMELGGVDAGCRTTWYGPENDPEYRYELNHLLDEQLDTRPTWWAYKAYAESVATRVASTSGHPMVTVFASRASNFDNVAQLTIGYTNTDFSDPDMVTDVSIELSGLGALPFLVAQDEVRVNVYRIPHAGSDPLAPGAGEQILKELEWVSEQFLPVNGGNASFEIQGINLYEAYVVKITDPSEAPPEDTAPEFSVDVESVDLSAYYGETSISAEFTVTNIGGREMNWRVGTGYEIAATFTPDSGTLAQYESQAISAIFDITGVEAGSYTDVFYLSAPEAKETFEVPVNLTIHENLAPVANPQFEITNEGEALDVTLDYSDDVGQGGTYTFSIVDLPANGSLVEIGSGLYRYTPADGFFGEDAFTWQVNDGLLDSNIGTVSVGVNQIPTAEPQSLVTVEAVGVGIQLGYSDDALPGPYTITITSDPLHGALSEAQGFGQYIYTPNLGFDGIDSFTWKINDGLADSPDAVVTVTVENGAELGVDVSTVEFEAIFGMTEASSEFTISNVGGQSMEWAIVSALPVSFEPSMGVLAAGAAVTVRSTAPIAGLPDGTYEDQITLRGRGAVNDGMALPLSLSIAANERPEAHAVWTTVTAGVPTEIQLNYTDDGPGPYTFTVWNLLHGTVEDLGGGRILYTADPDFVGADWGNWSVHDGYFESLADGLFITIESP